MATVFPKETFSSSLSYLFPPKLQLNLHQWCFVLQDPSVPWPGFNNSLKMWFRLCLKYFLTIKVVIKLHANESHEITHVLYSTF